MNKKIYFQASIFLSILLIILYVYFIYFKNDYKILVKTEDNITNNNSIESKDDLITNFPEIEYFYNLLDEQLIYLAESVKNIIVIINDLINSY